MESPQSSVVRRDDVETETGAEQATRGTVSRVGFWACLSAVVLGLNYFIVVGSVVASGFKWPPPEEFQILSYSLNMVSAAVWITIMACVYMYAPAGKKLCGLLALALTITGAALVTLNYYVQLAVVLPAGRAGAPGVEWFELWGEHSVMMAADVLGWGFFLGLAPLWIFPLLTGGTFASWARWLFVANGALSLMTVVGYALGNQVVGAVGPLVWSTALPAATVLLGLVFRRAGEGEKVGGGA